MQKQGIAIKDVAISGDGQSALIGDIAGSAQFFRRHAIGYVPERLIPSDLQVTGVAISGDGTRAAIAHINGKVNLYRNDNRWSDIGAPLEHGGAVIDVAFSPDSKILATGGANNIVRFWRADDGQPFGSPLQHDQPVVDITFKDDGRILMTGSGDRAVRLWRIDSPRSTWRAFWDRVARS